VSWHRDLSGGLVVAAVVALSAGTASAAAPVAAPDAPPEQAVVAEPRIIGGARASISDHPWTVYLRTASGFQFCGGTLVGSSSVVTAAHCSVDSTPGTLFVVAGREDTQSAEGIVAAVTDIWVHPEFDRVRYRNDVSILTVDRALPYGVLPLATGEDTALYAPGTPAEILGWGTTEGGSVSRFLLSAEVPVSSDASCAQAYGTSYDPTVMTCAGLPQGGVDACQGDSGGPLVAGGRLIGITSFGIGCGEPGLPGVYTRVAAFADVITAQLGASGPLNEEPGTP